MPGEKGQRNNMIAHCDDGEFCYTREIHPITPHVNDMVEFLAFLYGKPSTNPKGGERGI